MLNNYNIPGVVAAGWGAMPFTAHPLTTVVGVGIEIPHIPNPTRADVAEWHSKYVTALTSLFDRHKAQFSDPVARLELY